MIDLPAMPPCPADKRGRHALGALFPAEASFDLTLFCERCGMVRRLPMTGEVDVALDMLSADEIRRRVGAMFP